MKVYCKDCQWIREYGVENCKVNYVCAHSSNRKNDWYQSKGDNPILPSQLNRKNKCKNYLSVKDWLDKQKEE